MKQKADHHLEFLADPTGKLVTAGNAQVINKGSLSKRGRSTSVRAQSVIGNTGPGAGGDEDAAGESDDAVGEGDGAEDFQNRAERPKSAEGANPPGECE